MADVKYWDDQKRPIATSDNELLIYFRSIPGTTAAANVPYLLNCPITALLRISSSGNLPKFIYKGALNPENKVFLYQLSDGNPNINSLCNGVNAGSLVPIPVIGVIASITYVVPVPVVGIISSLKLNYFTLTIFGYDNSGSGGGIWVLNTSYSNAFLNGTEVTLNVSVFNSHFSSTGAKDNFVNEKITRFDVNSIGIPNFDITISSSDNANLPAGSSIIIQASTGYILYTGQPITENGSGSLIEFFSIKYNLN